MMFSANSLRIGARRSIGAVAVAASLFVVAPALAQQPASTPAALKAAAEIVKLTGALELFAPIVPGVVEQSRQFFVQQNPALTVDANEVAAQVRKELEPRVNEVNTKVIEIYASHFTEQELKDIVSFYSSPAGKKLLAQQPKLVDESLKFGQEWANALSDEVIGKIREGLKKKGHKL